MRSRRSHRTLGLIGALAGSLGLAVLTTAATPRTLCACISKTSAYLASMKAELRNLGSAQERFFTDSLRYAASESALAAHGYGRSNNVQLVSLSAWSGGFSARVRLSPETRVRGQGAFFVAPSAMTRECSITVGPFADGSVNRFDGEPQCDPPPLDRGRFVMAGAYALLVLFAIIARSARAGASLPPMGAGVIITFLLLSAVHPFWSDYRMKDACTFGVGTEWLSLCLAAIVAVWMLVRSREDWKRPSPA